MAIDIAISLTDTEQASVQELALRVSPDAPGPQIISWAQTQCKAGLRAAVIKRWNDVIRDEAQALINTQAARGETDFPEVSI